MQIMRIVVILGAFLLGASLASAGPADDCNQVRDLGRQLRGCTAYIDKGIGAPENLATAYLNRANIYAQRGKHGLALGDYAAAMAWILATRSLRTIAAIYTSTRSGTSWRSRTTREPSSSIGNLVSRS